MNTTQKDLRHYGILGMRWGRRRATSVSRGAPSDDHARAASIGKKHISEMSNDEIKELAARLELEKKYRNLTKKELNEGQKAVKEVLTNTGKMALSGVLVTSGAVAGKIIFDAATKKLAKNAKAMKILNLVVDAAVKKG